MPTIRTYWQCYMCMLRKSTEPPEAACGKKPCEMIREHCSKSALDPGAVEPDSRTTMCTWEVLPSDSRFPIVASGMSTDAGKAQRDVESAMTAPGAGFGHLVRTAIPGLAPHFDERMTWPPLGEVQQCRRTRNGGFSWRPLYPAMTPEAAAS